MTRSEVRIERPAALDAAEARALDAVLAEARPHLVPADGWLEPAADRVDEADVDDERWVYVAYRADEAVGLLDARLSAPEPGVVTIVHVAVARAHRGRGLGRALVEALARDVADGRGDRLRACVLGDSSQGFWGGLDFERVGEAYLRQI